MDFTWLKVNAWERYPGLLHGFMGRRGGKSEGPYAGLNVSYRVGDDVKTVSQNVCDLKLAIGIHDGRIVTMRQVHGNDLLEVRDKSVKEAGEADGMVTAQRDIFLAVLTADCVPILFVAPQERVVAAVHAGWRGSVAGIAAKAVRYFEDHHNVAPASLEAALGPAIGGCCYEVGDEVIEPLYAHWGDLGKACVHASAVRPHLDLRRLNRGILAEAGVPAERIFELGPCTACAADEFFSYRRERGETGRQMSVIGWQS